MSTARVWPASRSGDENSFTSRNAALDEFTRGQWVERGSEQKGEAADSSKNEKNVASTNLGDVLKATAERSPKVEAARRRYEASTHKYAQAVSLPDPMLQWKYFVRNVETRTGPQKWALGLSQRVPYPGKLIIAGRIANRQAEAAYLRYLASMRNALAEAKEIYFELYYIDRAQGVTREVQKLYERYAALAAGDQKDGGTKLPETFRAESQRAQLGYDLVLLKEMRLAEAERLKAVMGADAHIEIGRTQDVGVPPPLQTPLDKLRDIALAHNQELAAAGVEVQRARYQAKYARRAPIPDLTIGAQYIKTGQPVRALRNTDDGGKDPIVLGVGVSIPLWFPKYRAMAKEAEEMEQAALSDKKAVWLGLRADLARAYFSLSNASRLVRLYRETLLPQSRQALQSAEELYRKGQANLASILETTATYHNFELARLRAVADFYRDVARIERLLGTSLDLRPARANSVEKGASKVEPDTIKQGEVGK